jgi:phage-related holin
MTIKLEDTAILLKDSTKKECMQNKDNHLMLGYESANDLLNSVFGLKLSAINFMASILGILTTFITSYIYDDAKAVYTLLSLIILDSFTGILKALKNKTFSSSRLPRILVIMVIYMSLLGIGWNLSKVSDFYYWIPSALYFGFVTTLVVSIIENLNQLGLISDSVYNVIKNKIDLLQKFIFGKNFKKK